MPLSPYEGTTTTIVEVSSGSTLPTLAPVTDIIEKLTLQIVGQFFVTMRYCIKLILSGWISFEFVRSHLENQVENIRQTRDFDRMTVYQALFEKLGTYSKDLKNLERANLVVDAQWVSEDLHIRQEQE